MTALYYSFVTMSTLGYGDIVPRSSLARMAAALQAIVGQLYLVVLVSRLVGIHIAQASESVAHFELDVLERHQGVSSFFSGDTVAG